MNLVVRSALPDETLAPEIRTAVRGRTRRSRSSAALDGGRFRGPPRARVSWRSCWIFAALALLLAAIGTYGILSYSVSERRNEIGIHMALGATRGSVLGMILGQGMRLTIVGLVAGLVASFGLTRLLRRSSST